MNPAHHEMASVLVQVVLEMTPAPVGCDVYVTRLSFFFPSLFTYWTWDYVLRGL